MCSMGIKQEELETCVQLKCYWDHREVVRLAYMTAMLWCMDPGCGGRTGQEGEQGKVLLM